MDNVLKKIKDAEQLFSSYEITACTWRKAGKQSYDRGGNRPVQKRQERIGQLYIER